MIVAAVRPDSWNLPLLLHVLGATVLVGALAAGLAAVILSRREGGGGLERLAFRVFLVGAFPAFVVMRGAAEWVKEKEGVSGDAAWIGVGYGVSDTGLLLLVIVTVLAGLAARRAGRGERPGALGSVSAALVSLLLLGYGIAIWAMTTKPD